MSTESKDKGGWLLVAILLLGGLVGATGAALYWRASASDAEQRLRAAMEQEVRAREAEEHARRAAEGARRAAERLAALEAEREMRQAPMPRAKP